jgi:hypothetical protein
MAEKVPIIGPQRNARTASATLTNETERPEQGAGMEIAQRIPPEALAQR